MTSFGLFFLALVRYPLPLLPPLPPSGARCLSLRHFTRGPIGRSGFLPDGVGHVDDPPGTGLLGRRRSSRRCRRCRTARCRTATRRTGRSPRAAPATTRTFFPPITRAAAAATTATTAAAAAAAAAVALTDAQLKVYPLPPLAPPP